MTNAHAPLVFVSSTCYDLQQIRADMKKFIESLGFHPVLSEYSTFPVNPDVDAVQNCLQIIQDSADIFVLIVGDRYGSSDDKGKAIINLEYSRAKARGIPKYIFVKKRILDLQLVWQKNPQGDYSDVVDSPRLFEFVSSLRNPAEGWVFPFETAQDIEDTLRKQWAYLFHDCLRLRTRAKQSAIPESLMELNGEPLRLVIERPDFWEYLLFSSTLARQIDQSKKLKMDYAYGTSLGSGRCLDTRQMVDWLQQKFNDLQRLASTMKTLFDTALPEAFGPPGVSGDAERIVYAATRVGECYRTAMEWGLEFRRVTVPDPLSRALAIAATMVEGVVTPIESFSQNFVKEMSDVVTNPSAAGEHREIRLMLTLTIDERLTKEFGDELEKAMRQLM